MPIICYRPRAAYAAAHRHPQLLPPDDNCRFGGGAYPDDDPSDDFYWAATELWLTTKEASFRQAVLSSTHHRRDVFDLGGFDFDRVAAVAMLDLARSGQELPDHHRVRQVLREAADRLLDIQREQPWGQPYAPDTGWVWGSNGRLLNNLVVLATAHIVEREPDYLAAVAVGMDYLLGRNALGHSYITGYGTDFTRHQRTRQFAHDQDPAFPPPPAGPSAWSEFDTIPRFPVRQATHRPATAMLLPRRADLGGDQRHLHPLERTAGHNAAYLTATAPTPRWR